jgi:hypothetical protein
MKRSTLHRYTRKAHRYLGLILGLQFMAWTLGGLYFSWMDIDEIRGSDLRVEAGPLPIAPGQAALGQLLDSLMRAMPEMAVHHIQVVDILGILYYQLKVGHGHHKQVLLFDARDGKPKAALQAEEAAEVARKALKNPGPVVSVEYLAQADGHHEYREKPLPAYAVGLGGERPATVYVAAELGTVQALRHDAWRAFDFLWMLHTMDYEGRDNFNNWLLRAFSAFGLITIASGFLLYALTARFRR